MKNEVFDILPGGRLDIPVPVGTESGDPVLFGTRPAVAEIDRMSDGKATCRLFGVFNFTVTATTNPIAAGDLLYFHAGSPATIDNVASGGTVYGRAYGSMAVGTGALPVLIG